MPRVKIDVTQDDIEEAYRMCRPDSYNQATHCPIALAASRIFNKLVIVGQQLNFPDGTRAPLGPHELAFTRDFDSGKSVKPFSFEVDIVE